MLQYGKTAEEIAIEENQIELGKIAYKTNNKKMLYLAPSNEILEQTKDRIIEHIRGKVGMQLPAYGYASSRQSRTP